MQEKLIEYWLDSANERAYQGTFCQILANRKHTVVHSTRHMPMEFGKDVISINENKEPCAFQLKGNPGGRLTLAQFAEVQPQLIQLVVQPVVFLGFPSKPHRSFLVTNGEVEEEVQRAIDDMNRGFIRQGYNEHQLITVISRGMILRWAQESAEALWPDDIFFQEKIIKHWNMSGEGELDYDVFMDGLRQMLGLQEDPHNRPTQKNAKRNATAAALYTSVLIKNFSASNNHDAIISAWTIYISHCIAMVERYNLNFDKTVRKAVELAEQLILASLREIFEEVKAKFEEIKINRAKNKKEMRSELVFFDFNPLTDTILWRARALRIRAFLAILGFWLRETGEGSEDDRGFLRTVLRPEPKSLEIWGEAAIPQALSVFWYLRSIDPTVQPNFGTYLILKAIFSACFNTQERRMPTPYHHLEECIRYKHRDFLKCDVEAMENEIQERSSYFAESLMHCFVRTNLKSFAKELWPNLTRLTHHSYEPRNSWEFPLWRSESGVLLSKQLPKTKEWEALKDEARRVGASILPGYYKEKPLMLLLFIIFFPHRASPNVVRFLSYKFGQAWFLQSPVEEDL